MEEVSELQKVSFNVPRKELNKLNNFYLENFGYDIYTQLQIFIFSELKQCENTSGTVPVAHPHPSLTLDYKYDSPRLAFDVTYEDGSVYKTCYDDYDKLMSLWTEWSKYGFSKKSRDLVLNKVLPKRVQNINCVGKKYVVSKKINGKMCEFGRYNSWEDAFLVKCFLEENGWNLKYSMSNLKKSIEECNQNNSAEYMLKIVRGEYEL